MSTVIDRLNSLAETWTGLAWAIVWQSTLLALAVAAICFVWKRSSPGVRYWLWQIVAIKLLLMPFWTWAIPLPAPFVPTPVEPPVTIAPPLIVDTEPATATDDDVIATEPPAITMIETPRPPVISEPPATPPVTERNGLERVTWRTWLFAVWLAAVVWQIARLVRQHRNLKKLLRDAMTNAVDARCASLLRECAAELNLRRVPGLQFTEVECSPFVCGMTAPVLVMPESLCARLDDTQLRQVLLHELAHVSRRDLVWGWLPELARLVYFFHPIAHWASARIRLERELACDQIAMTYTNRPAADYAATLVHVVTHASQPHVLKAAVTSLGLDGGSTNKEP